MTWTADNFRYRVWRCDPGVERSSWRWEAREHRERSAYNGPIPPPPPWCRDGIAGSEDGARRQAQSVIEQEIEQRNAQWETPVIDKPPVVMVDAVVTIPPARQGLPRANPMRPERRSRTRRWRFK